MIRHLQYVYFRFKWRILSAKKSGLGLVGVVGLVLGLQKLSQRRIDL